MRTRPLIGQKAWFGPRPNGWGLSPVSAEGWVVTVAAVAAVIAAVTMERRERWTAFLPVILLLAITFLKGTSPGGRREWEEFERSKDQQEPLN